MSRLTAPARRKTARRPLAARFGWPPSRRALKATMGLIALGLVAGGGAYVWRFGPPETAIALWRDARATTLAASGALGLSVAEIYVEGRAETPAADVLRTLNLGRGAPILGFSPTAVKTALEDLPWIRRADVERRLPSTVYVRLVERQPLALWQREGRMTPIDRDGEEIRGVPAARFGHLPVVVGDDAPRNAAALLALLALEPEIAQRVVAAVRVGGRRWNVRLGGADGAGDIDVQLPEINPGAAWARLAELDREKRLLDRRVSNIDLRLPDRLILRVVRDAPPPPPAKPRRTPNRPT